MSTAAIEIRNVSKSFRIMHRTQRHNTLRDTLAAMPRNLLGRSRSMLRRQRSESEEFWALRDVSFEVPTGEVLGIIGQNGAGKSTLLKILSRITEPTSGEVVLRGRVGSLLEVGTGFHSELTGGENIYLSGAILGMRQREIDGKFDEIVAFAEVERFIDTPVKHYSSGMYLRLAFAVASYLDPEILLVDEVLAVGDAQFQRKCLGKMEDVASEGRTVLLVSHNMTAVQSLCSRVVWLRQGEVAGDGPCAEIVHRYLNEMVARRGSRHWPEPGAAPGNDDVRLHQAGVRRLDGLDDLPITIRSPFALDFSYWNLRPDARLHVTIHVHSEQGVLAFSSASLDDPEWRERPFPAGLFRTSCIIPGDLLNDGTHRVDLLVVRDHGHLLYRFNDLLSFDVRDERQPGAGWHGKWPGVVRPMLAWHTEHLETHVHGAHDVVRR